MVCSFRTNTLIDKKGEFETNDSPTKKMNDRTEFISAKRKQIIKKRKLNENNMNFLVECLENHN